MRLTKKGRERDRKRQRERERDRQTDRQTDRETCNNLTFDFSSSPSTTRSSRTTFRATPTLSSPGDRYDRSVEIHFFTILTKNLFFGALSREY